MVKGLINKSVKIQRFSSKNGTLLYSEDLIKRVKVGDLGLIWIREQKVLLGNS